MSASPAACVDALVVALSRFEPGAYSPTDCVVLVEKLAQAEKACAVARVLAAERAAECGAHRASGFVDAVDWLAGVAGTSVGEAERELSTARRLADLPDTLAAATSGELSLDQAEEIARTERACPGSEAEMLVTARRGGLRSLRDEGRKRRLAAIDVAELARRQHQSRSLRHWRDELGMVRGSFALEPHVGVALVNRLDAEADRLRRRANKAGNNWPEPHERHRADALAAMVEGKAKGHSARAEVVLVANLDTAECHIVGGGPVPAARVSQAIDRGAFVKGVVHDGVAVTHVRHYGKAMPVVLRTALSLGSPPDFDGASCVECGKGFHLEWDHVDPRANGGAWSIDNNEARCWWCHVEKTERDRRAGLLGAAARARGPTPATACRGNSSPPR